MPERSWAGFKQVKVGLGSCFWRFAGSQLEYAFVGALIEHVPFRGREFMADFALFQTSLQLAQCDEVALGDDQIEVRHVTLQFPDYCLAMLGRVQRIFNIALRVAAFAKNRSQIN